MFKNNQMKIQQHLMNHFFNDTKHLHMITQYSDSKTVFVS